MKHWKTLIKVGGWQRSMDEGSTYFRNIGRGSTHNQTVTWNWGEMRWLLYRGSKILMFRTLANALAHAQRRGQGRRT